MFRYFHLLAPVLGDESVCHEVDGAAADATLLPLTDKDADMCRFHCDQYLRVVVLMIPFKD